MMNFVLASFVHGVTPLVSHLYNSLITYPQKKKKKSLTYNLATFSASDVDYFFGGGGR